jgi:hypothetical protein
LREFRNEIESTAVSREVHHFASLFHQWTLRGEWNEADGLIVMDVDVDVDVDVELSINFDSTI